MSRLALRAVAPWIALAFLLPLPVDGQDGERGVYLKLVDSAPGSVASVTDHLASVISDTEGAWEVLATYDAAVQAPCEYGARVMVLYSDAYATSLMAQGIQAAFAVPLRIAVFSDETGVHVGATNPLNLNRTMVIEEGHQEAWDTAVEDLRGLAAEAFPDQAVAAAEYGQVRKKGRIGRTMGIMAGGPFVDKVKVATSVPTVGNDVGSVAQALMEGIAHVEGDWKWGIRPVYSALLPGVNAAVIGVTGERMEADAFAIVGAGNADERKELSCPGVGHAPAFPIEIVVAEQEGEIQVLLVGAMYRMKMYFEDAGRWKFAQNMGMPGSIEDEMKDKIRSVLGTSDR